MPTNRRIFELTILGCSGGPLSDRTCSYLLKPSRIQYNEILTTDNRKISHNCVLAVDAGTGIASISDILKYNDSNKLSDNILIGAYDKDVSEYERCHFYQNLENLTLSHPFKNLMKNSTTYQVAWKILNTISGYLITHSHLDHTSGLIINSQSFNSTKHVYGTKESMDILKDSIFDGRSWPDMVKINIVKLHVLQQSCPSKQLNDFYNIVCSPVAHGRMDNGKTYMSSAYLVTDRSTDYSILIFGDVESDKSSSENYNKNIWRSIAPLILQDKLSTIVIECSFPNKPPPLFGHMTPRFLINELLVLRKICIDQETMSSAKRESVSPLSSLYTESALQPLKNINILITHVKEMPMAQNPRTLIFDQLNELNKCYRLGINFTIVLPGLSYIV